MFYDSVVTSESFYIVKVRLLPLLLECHSMACQGWTFPTTLYISGREITLTVHATMEEVEGSSFFGGGVS